VSTNGHDVSLGVMPGLEQSIMDVLTQYRPGALGVCEVDPKIQITLPVHLWDWWDHFEFVTLPSQGAGSTTAVTMFTVPTDERALLHMVRAARNSGDNQVGTFNTVNPVGYRAGSQAERPFQILATRIAAPFWPDPGATQALYISQVAAPLLCEPGTLINLTPDGTGVAGTVWACSLSMWRSKLVRARAP